VNELLERLKEDFQNEEARYAYAESVANAYISEQIKKLREDRGLSQEELAALIGTKQSGISRLQSRDYSAWKVETLRKLAKAFGVRLRISFEDSAQSRMTSQVLTRAIQCPANSLKTQPLVHRRKTATLWQPLQRNLRRS
jgi:ribosome-binding protein aMBF1 (putative translation factor)